MPIATPTSSPYNARIEAFLDRVELACVLDHSGRAGNGFFLTIFDPHREVIACPWVHYTYSYITAAFPGLTEINAEQARVFAADKSYFRYLYAEPTGEIGAMITRMGGEPETPFNRGKLRTVFDGFMAERTSVSRRELVLLPFVALAIARDYDLDKVKYVLVSDAVSLRDEPVIEGFSGRVVDYIVEDFPRARLISLVRDPRATFASSRHQFVNAQGNMYGFTPGTYFTRLAELWRHDLRLDNGSIYLYWLLYLAQTARTIYRQKARYKEHFRTVRNEDLNRDFVNTMRELSAWLGVSFLDVWAEEEFQPTMLGVPWHGTGAYNSRYQTYVNGRLLNDSRTMAAKAVGPNLYVTQRWRTRLSRREVALIDQLFREEMADLGYEPLDGTPNRSDLACLLRTALLPFVGELPSWGWIRRGWHDGMLEIGRRLFYALTFPPMYVLSRVLLFRFVLGRGFFRDVVEQGDRVHGDGSTRSRPEASRGLGRIARS